MTKSAPPPPPPTGGNGKYVAALVVAVGGIIALLAFKQCGDRQTTVTQIVSAKPTATPTATVNEEIPLPPELPDASADTGPVKQAQAGGDPCAVKACNGKSTDDIEGALALRARAAKKCYNQLLAQDNSLTGKVKVKVRVAANGQVCSVAAVSNDTGSPSVERCATNPFHGVQLSPPKGGCVDIEIPLNFVPGGR